MIEIYTDGACAGNPGPGGWGALIVDGAMEREISGGESATTNNRMELTAAIEALGATAGAKDVVLYTDSQYLQLGITQWLAAWKQKGWRTAAGGPVKNRDLWERLDALLVGRRVAWRWLRGHAGDAGNARADALARAALKDVTRRSRSPGAWG